MLSTKLGLTKVSPPICFFDYTFVANDFVGNDVDSNSLTPKNKPKKLLLNPVQGYKSFG
jgi:hypothetical protein